MPLRAVYLGGKVYFSPSFACQWEVLDFSLEKPGFFQGENPVNGGGGTARITECSKINALVSVCWWAQYHAKWPDGQPGAWALGKPESLTRPCFFCIFEKSGKIEPNDLAVSQLRGSKIAVISAHVPGQHMWASLGVLARALVQVLQNSGSRMVVLRFTTLSARDRHWRNPREFFFRECSNIKSARVGALTGSVPRKMAEALQRVSALIRNQTHVDWLSATSLNHLSIGSYPLLEKNGI